MAHCELSQVIRAEKTLEPDSIMQFIRQRLAAAAKIELTPQAPGVYVIKGRMKQKVFTPVVAFSARFQVSVEGSKAKVLSAVETKPTWVFYLLMAIGLPLCLLLGFGIPIVVVALALWITQKAKPGRALEEILRAAGTEFSF